MASTPPPDNPLWRQRLQERKVQTTSWIDQRSHVLSWGGIIAGGLFTTIAVWPLAITVWDFLGLSEGQTWRLTLCGLGALALATGVWGATRKRTPPVRLIWLILAAWLVASATVTALTGFAWLLLETPRWTPPEELTPRHLESITTRAFAIVAGLGGVALLVIAYRRQRTTEADALRAEAANARAQLSSEREVAKLFTDTFDSASEKLGSDHAAVRLAGVHALARLADEAPQGREDLTQMVIDVLCAYLRMPYAPTPNNPFKDTTEELVTEYRKQELEYSSLREVRHTIIRIIGDRLRWPTRWRGKHYDFTGVVFDGGSLGGAVFSGGSASFKDAKFTSGDVQFFDAKFTGGIVSFQGAKFQGGVVNFMNSEFSGGEVNFMNSEFSGGEVIFLDTKFTGGKIKFPGVNFTGSAVSFYRSELTQGELSFSGSEFAKGRINFSKACLAGGRTSFHRAKFTGAAVSFLDAEFSGGETSFLESEFSDGKVEFVYTEFTGSRVDFRRSIFSGGEVNFVSNKFISGILDFQDASGTPPFNLIESIRDAAPEVIITPDHWAGNSTEIG